MADTAHGSAPPGGEFRLQIVTPSRQVEDTQVTIASLPGMEGYFGVLAGHQPLLTSLKPGVIYYEEGGMPRRIAVSGGIAEITAERTLVLARTCEKVDEIDAERARRALSQAEDAIARLSPESDEWTAALVERDRAQSRIETIEGGE